LKASPCNESVATDTIFSEVPAVDNGSTAAQFFVGRDSLVADAYGVKTDKKMFTTMRITYGRGDLWISSLVIGQKPKSVIRSRTFSVLLSLMTGKVNLITNTRIVLSEVVAQSNPGPTSSITGLERQHTHGCSV
jgi:hypothetical protein